VISLTGSHLYVGNYRAEELASRFGTPLYVYDLDTVTENYMRLLRSIPYSNVEILYSCTANSNPWILKTLRDLGSGLDTVSPFEVLLGIKLGFSKERILFTGNNVSDEEMRFVRGDLGVMVNVDSISQLRRYGKLFPGTEVSIRINPGVGAGHHGYTVTGGITKFGIYLDHIIKVKEIVAEYSLKVVGIHAHIGSGILDVEPYMRTLEVLLKIAEEFKDLEFIDIGGGFGIPYRPEERLLDLNILGAEVAKRLEKFSMNGHVKLKMEPGRYIIGNAGVLLTRVIDIKEAVVGGFKKVFVGVDSGMNHLIRPALYGAYHEVIAVSKVDWPKEMVADVVGNVCESGDVLARDMVLPRLEEGDVLAIMNAGAYGYSMSSNYNLRPRPAEVVVSKDRVWLARKKETFEDLLRTAVL